MPTERLHVRNFAGIKEAEIELSRITVLIGPQASGKSVCAKLLFFFKQTIRRMTLGVVDEHAKAELRAEDRKLFLTYFPPSSWSAGVFVIHYSYGAISVTVNRKDINSSTVEIGYSQYFDQLIRTARSVLRNIAEPQYAGLLSFTRSYMAERVQGGVNKKTLQDGLPAASNLNYFIPAGRSFFSALQNSVLSIIAASRSVDPFMAEFGSIYETSRSVLHQTGSTDPVPGSGLYDRVNRLLGGTYFRYKGDDFIQTPDGRQVPIGNSSSGQQEILPLAITLVAIARAFQSATFSTMFIEEPEAHLYPSAQREIVHFFSTVTDLSSEDSSSQYFITTHSPYILSALNNLVYGGKIARDHTDKLTRVKALLGEAVLVEPSQIAAYSMEGGTARSIIDPETGLVEATLLDRVSGELAQEFDALMDIEFGEE